MPLIVHLLDYCWCAMSKGISHFQDNDVLNFCPFSPLMVDVLRVDNEICSNITLF